ncbi:MAG: phosphoribosylformylglycinamidine synthase subunit PurQ [Alphaproteobacteria bacterium]
MRSAVVVFPGSNRDHDVIAALDAVGAKPQAVWHADTELPRTDLVVLPGGFSYGDYLRSGAIAARAPIIGAVIAAASRGTPILGVCNGFQILCEIGLLPGVLMRNSGLHFICRSIPLRVETTKSVFTRAYREGEVFDCPMAHGDGNYRADAETLKRLNFEDRVAFRYVDAGGNATRAADVNGSVENIAGILNADRNVLGMMPHPENAIDDAQGGTGGRLLFESVVGALEPA